MNDIVIYNCNIGHWDGFNCPEEAVLCFDRLINNPCRVLVNRYNLKSETEYLMFILPHISKLFKIDRNKLLDEWISHFCIYKVFGEK
jgi:hypothetical protein